MAKKQEQLGITDAEFDEVPAPKPQRECWKLNVHKSSLPLGDPLGDRTINVLAPNFRRAALKADNWAKANEGWQVISLIYSPDTVI